MAAKPAPGSPRQHTGQATRPRRNRRGHDRTEAAWAKALRGRPVPASSADHPAPAQPRRPPLQLPAGRSRNQLRSFTGAARIVTVDMLKPVSSFECCSRGHTRTSPRADFLRLQRTPAWRTLAAADLPLTHQAPRRARRPLLDDFGVPRPRGRQRRTHRDASRANRGRRLRRMGLGHRKR